MFIMHVRLAQTLELDYYLQNFQVPDLKLGCQTSDKTFGILQMLSCVLHALQCPRREQDFLNFNLRFAVPDTTGVSLNTHAIAPYNNMRNAYLSNPLIYQYSCIYKECEN